MTDSRFTRRSVIAWIAQLVAAGVLGMAAVMKLTGNPDSIGLFTTLGVEPWGRFAVGGLEVVAVVLLLRPRTAVVGGGLAVLLMSGAVVAHLTRLGIAYQGDPSLFLMALMVMAAGTGTVLLRRA